MSAGTVYAKRFAGGFADGSGGATPIDSTFLNAVEAALLQLIGSAPTADGQVAQWDFANTRFGPALLLNKNVDPAAAIAKSKLDFTGANGIVNADVAGAAAIAKSKLDFGAGLVNADVSAVAAIVGSKLATGLTGPPGSELAYNEFTVPVNAVATTEATANTVVTASAVTFDGSTPVWIEFFSPDIAPDNAAVGRRVIFALYDGAASIGLLGIGPYSQVVGNSADIPLRLARKLTPAAATKTYSVRAFVSAGTTVVGAGVGGVGAQVPGYIRITKV